MFNKKLHEKIHQQAAMLDQHKAILDAIHASTASVTFDLNANVVESNALFQQVMGYSASSLLGMNHRAFCESGYAGSPAYQAFWQSLREGKPFIGRVKRMRSNGDEVWLEATYNPIKDASGKITGFIKFATDITPAGARGLAQPGGARRSEPGDGQYRIYSGWHHHQGQ
jgi:methyl-accepting chemotaxis protein